MDEYITLEVPEINGTGLNDDDPFLGYLRNKYPKLRDWSFTDPLRESTANIVRGFSPSRMEIERLQGLVGLDDEAFRARNQDRLLGLLPRNVRDDYLRGQIESLTEGRERVGKIADAIAPTPHAQPDSLLGKAGYTALKMIPHIAAAVPMIHALGPMGYAGVNTFTGNQSAQENVYDALRSQGLSPDEAYQQATAFTPNAIDALIRGGANFGTMGLLSKTPVTVLQRFPYAGAFSPYAQTAGNIAMASGVSGLGAMGEQALTNYRTNTENDIAELAKTGLKSAAITGGIGLANAAFNWRNLRELQRQYWENVNAKPIEYNLPDSDNGSAGGSPSPNNPNNPNNNGGGDFPQLEVMTPEKAARLQKRGEILAKYKLPPETDLWKGINDGSIPDDTAVNILVDMGAKPDIARGIVTGSKTLADIERGANNLSRGVPKSAQETPRQPQTFEFNANEWQDPLFPKSRPVKTMDKPDSPNIGTPSETPQTNTPNSQTDTTITPPPAIPPNTAQPQKNTPVWRYQGGIGSQPADKVLQLDDDDRLLGNQEGTFRNGTLTVPDAEGNPTNVYVQFNGSKSNPAVTFSLVPHETNNAKEADLDVAWYDIRRNQFGALARGENDSLVDPIIQQFRQHLGDFFTPNKTEPTQQTNPYPTPADFLADMKAKKMQTQSQIRKLKKDLQPQTTDITALGKGKEYTSAERKFGNIQTRIQNADEQISSIKQPSEKQNIFGNLHSLMTRNDMYGQTKREVSNISGNQQNITPEQTEQSSRIMAFGTNEAFYDDEQADNSFAVNNALELDIPNDHSPDTQQDMPKITALGFKPNINKPGASHLMPDLQNATSNKFSPNIDKPNVSHFKPDMQDVTASRISPNVEKPGSSLFRPDLQKPNVVRGLDGLEDILQPPQKVTALGDSQQPKSESVGIAENLKNIVESNTTQQSQTKLQPVGKPFLDVQDELGRVKQVTNPEAVKIRDSNLQLLDNAENDEERTRILNTLSHQQLKDMADTGAFGVNYHQGQTKKDYIDSIIAKRNENNRREQTTANTTIPATATADTDYSFNLEDSYQGMPKQELKAAADKNNSLISSIKDEDTLRKRLSGLHVPMLRAMSGISGSGYKKEDFINEIVRVATRPIPDSATLKAGEFSVPGVNSMWTVKPNKAGNIFTIDNDDIPHSSMVYDPKGNYFMSLSSLDRDTTGAVQDYFREHIKDFYEDGGNQTQTVQTPSSAPVAENPATVKSDKHGKVRLQPLGNDNPDEIAEQNLDILRRTPNDYERKKLLNAQSMKTADLIRMREYIMRKYNTGMGVQGKRNDIINSIVKFIGRNNTTPPAQDSKPVTPQAETTVPQVQEERPTKLTPTGSLFPTIVNGEHVQPDREKSLRIAKQNLDILRNAADNDERVKLLNSLTRDQLEDWQSFLWQLSPPVDLPGSPSRKKADYIKSFLKLIENEKNPDSAQTQTPVPSPVSDNVSPVRVVSFNDKHENEKQPEQQQQKSTETENTSNDSSMPDTPIIRLANRVKALILDALDEDKDINPFSNDDLLKWAAQEFGGTEGQGAFDTREAYDAMEMGINLAIAEAGITPGSAEDTYDVVNDIQRLLRILQTIPTQTNRTKEQVAFQQFSTPPTLAYLVNWLASIGGDNIALEPSAGTGNLAVFAHNAGAGLILNDYSKSGLRADILDALRWGEVYRKDALDIADILLPQLDDDERPDRVIMNPPFSAAGKQGTANSNQNGFQHVEQALRLLKDNGRLVAILGAGRDGTASSVKTWLKDIGQTYNVRALITVGGKAYQKYGTTFDNAVVVIDKTGATPKGGTVEYKFSGDFSNDEELYKLFNSFTDIVNDYKDRDEDNNERPEAENANSAGIPNTLKEAEKILSKLNDASYDELKDTAESLGVDVHSAVGTRDDSDGNRAKLRTAIKKALKADSEPATQQKSEEAKTSFHLKEAEEILAKLHDASFDELKDIAESLGVDVSFIGSNTAYMDSYNRAILRMMIAYAQNPISALDYDKIVAYAIRNARNKHEINGIIDAVYINHNDDDVAYKIYKSIADEIGMDKTFLDDLSKEAGKNLDNRSGLNLAIKTFLNDYFNDNEVKKPLPGKKEKEQSLPEPVTEIKPQKYVSRKKSEQPDDNDSSEDESPSIYSDYEPQEHSGIHLFDIAKQHPSQLVETTNMKTVHLPPLTYSPHLPDKMIQSGAISEAQLEAVAYAGQAFTQKLPSGQTKGFILGDGTGSGKGRTIAAIITDQLNQNHGGGKAVWFSVSADLFKDAQRDLENIGEDKKQLFELGETKLGDTIPTAKKGIMFTTYNTLIRTGKKKNDDNNTDNDSESDKSAEVAIDTKRIKQIVDWLGEDFDGVVAFDECHKINNLGGENSGFGISAPSQSADAARKLADALPHARILYVSATSATDPNNLRMFDRTGLWGENTPFANADKFAADIKAGGPNAMEMFARDAKSLGVFVARSLSPKGLTYRRLNYKLSKTERDMYNEVAQAWRTVDDAITQGFKAVGGDAESGKKDKGLAAKFRGRQLQCFNFLLTAFKTNALIEDAKKQLDDGNSVAIQIDSTYDAFIDRILKGKQKGDDLRDVIISPVEDLIGFVMDYFPIHKMRQVSVERPNGDNYITYETVIDEETGKPVVSQAALNIRNTLIAHLKRVRFNMSPLDRIINSLGGLANVAEVTRRKHRLIEQADGKIIDAKQPPSANKEVDAFNNGEKRVIIFSRAGNTGRSFHADKSFKNPQRRIHYLLEGGFSAFNAIQGFGRTHRSNESSQPEYVVVAADIPGEIRFISAIVRKLGQMGALTAGDRKNNTQGLYSEKDNMESRLAAIAMNHVMGNLLSGAYPEIPNGDEVIRQMGFEPDNFGKKDIPLKRIFNRILSLDLEIQDVLISYFNMEHEQLLLMAIQNGTADIGTENIRALDCETIQDKTILEDKAKGIKTKYLELKVKVKSRIRPFQNVSRVQHCEEFFIDQDGIIYAAKKNGQYETDEEGNQHFRASFDMKNGEPIQRYTLFTTDMNTSYATDALALQNKKQNQKRLFTPVSRETAEELWQSQSASMEKSHFETIHMISGVLLPIWNQLKQLKSSRVKRVILPDGTSIIGRILEESEVKNVLRSFRVDYEGKTYTVQDVLRELEKPKTFARLSNNWKLKYSRVSGEKRIEILYNDYHDIPRLQKLGALVKIIGSDERAFVPVGNNDVLHSVITFNNVTGFENDSSADDILDEAAQKINSNIPDSAKLYFIHPSFWNFINDPDDNPLIHESNYPLDSEPREYRYQASKNADSSKSAWQHIKEFGAKIWKGRHDIPEHT